MTAKNFSIPEFNKDAFHCPFCGTYSHMSWNTPHNLCAISKCSFCKKLSIWRIINSVEYHSGKTNQLQGEMLYPDFGFAPLPEQDMPDDVRIDYMEAANIFSKSPRGAAALLRLALQKLCIHLGGTGKNINEDIRALVAKQIISGRVVQVADTLRITGNNAVHPAELSDEDFDKVATKIFDLINFIVKKAITEPKELDELYESMPENARRAAEEKDAKALSNKNK